MMENISLSFTFQYNFLFLPNTTSHPSPIKVAPAELENLILTHPAIADTCVVGVPDEKAGELPKAYCVKKKGHEDITEDEIVQYVAGNLLQTIRLPPTLSNMQR